MSRPQRIQLKRKAGWQMPPDTIRCCRPGPWGNPFRVGRYEDDKGGGWAVSTDAWMRFFPTKLEAQEHAVQRFRATVQDEGRRHMIRVLLRGRNLACWCKPGEPCHADVLLEIANAEEPTEPAND